MPTSAGPNTFGEENLVFGYDLGDVANSYKGQPTVNHIADVGNPTEERARGEFGQYFNLVPIFETYGLVPYTLSMEIKGNIPGYCQVYMQNGSYTKYAFVSSAVNITTEWQRFVFPNITPSGPTAAWQTNTPGDNRAILATYTIYGSGRNPTIRNVQLERSAHVTPFTAETRSVTQGLIDLKGTSTIDLSNVSFTSNAQMTFDGTDDYVEVPNVNLPAPGLNHTLECVFQRNSGRTIINYGPAFTDAAKYYSLEVPFSALVATIRTSVGNTQLVSSTTISSNTWYHGVLTYNGSTVSLYINGVLAASASTSGSILNTSTPSLNIGRKNSGNGENINGRVGLVKIYNRALTVQEVRSNFNAVKKRFNI